MSPHRVHLEELSSVVERLRRFQSEFEQHLAAVDAEARRLHGSWTGEAAVAYREAHERWRSGARLMHEAVQVMQRNGSTAHGNYSAAGEVNRAMWQL